MTDLTPRVQQLLEKLSKEFSQEELPTEITIDQNGIQVSTSKKHYQMRRTNPRREPIGNIIHRNIARYKRDILNAKLLEYQVHILEGTIEAKVTHYLANYELGQTQKKTGIQLESLAGLGTVIEPYQEDPKQMTVIRKYITTKGHTATNICKLAKRSLQLLRARASPRDYQYLTSWVVFRAKDEDWDELIEAASMQNLLEQAIHLDEDLDSQELIFKDPVLLPES
jgi:hypothetical protein